MAAQISGKRQCVKPAGCIRGLLSFTLLNTRPQSQLVLHWKRSRGTIQKVLRDKGGKEQIKAGALLFTLFLQPLTMGWCQPPSCGSTRTSCSSGAHAPHPRGLTVTRFFWFWSLRENMRGKAAVWGWELHAEELLFLLVQHLEPAHQEGKGWPIPSKCLLRHHCFWPFHSQNTKSRPWRTLEIV